MTLSLSRIAVMTCLTIIGLTAGGCSQTASEAMGNDSRLSIAPVSNSCLRAKPSVQRPKLKRRHHRRRVRALPVARNRQSHLWGPSA
jgi:hypothetical protein